MKKLKVLPLSNLQIVFLLIGVVYAGSDESIVLSTPYANHDQITTSFELSRSTESLSNQSAVYNGTSFEDSSEFHVEYTDEPSNSSEITTSTTNIPRSSTRTRHGENVSSISYQFTTMEGSTSSTSVVGIHENVNTKHTLPLSTRTTQSTQFDDSNVTPDSEPSSVSVTFQSRSGTTYDSTSVPWSRAATHARSIPVPEHTTELPETRLSTTVPPTPSTSPISATTSSVEDPTTPNQVPSSSIDITTLFSDKTIKISTPSSKLKQPQTVPFTTAPSTVPVEDRYFVVIKSDDCPTLKANKFDRELSKALSALGVLNVTADISQTECQTKLNVNITATAPYSAIKLLEDSKKHNLTITIFNRTFKVVDIQKLDYTTKDSVSDSTPNVVNAVTNQEFNTYVAVGVCFGVVLIVCLAVCCMKCWVNGPSKKLRALRRSHTPLNPEDYTLTPLPRPTSLYVDYCRNSFTGDMCSTTSAGSVASTSPIVEKGIIQPFETCIVPLEDTVVPTAPPSDRRDSVESASSKDTRPLRINTVSSPGRPGGPVSPRDVLHGRPLIYDYGRSVGLPNASYHRY